MRSAVLSPHGFTLAETLVAMVLITLVLGVLEGSAASSLRQLRDDNSESLAARLVQRREESVLAGPCPPSSVSGTDSSGAVVSAWQVTTDGAVVRIAQTVRYPTAFGTHTETFQTAGMCQ
jgi:prepilin-type N-terminal cleavage/methylation domain-containing protein